MTSSIKNLERTLQNLNLTVLMPYLMATSPYLKNFYGVFRVTQGINIMTSLFMTIFQLLQQLQPVFINTTPIILMNSLLQMTALINVCLLTETFQAFRSLYLR